MILRTYKPEDCDEMIELFYQTVHTVNKKDYIVEQLNVWAMGREDKRKWNQSFLAHTTIVAEINGRIVGFGDIDGNYLDRLYVHKDFQGHKIATKILQTLEQCARLNKQLNILTHASITAKPFFEKLGYVVLKQQLVERNGIGLTNFVMEKII